MAIKKSKPKHLGRGLQSLMGPITSTQTQIDKAISDPQPEAIDLNLPVDKDLGESLRNIPVYSVKTNPYQPRTVFDNEQLQDLAESIKANGMIQPVITRKAGGGYELIAGERRFRAAQLAGLDKIPAIVRQATDKQMLELALVENIHRTDLNPIERAKAYENYINTFSITQSEAAGRLGENRSVVTNHLRLLELPQEIKQMLIDKQISMGHARAILALPTDELKQKLANRAMAGRLSVREVEAMVRRHLTKKPDDEKKTRQKPGNILDLESKLTRFLGTKVSIDARRGGRRGRISIEFYSLDEFDRITEQMGLSAEEDV